jgi:hypothetical protein
LNRAQQNGDKLLHEALQLVEKKATQNIESKRMENGKVVQNYIKLLEKKDKENLNKSAISQRSVPVRVRDGRSSDRKSQQRGSVPKSPLE